MSATYLYYCNHCQKMFGGDKPGDTVKVCSACQGKLKATGFTLDEWNEMTADEKDDHKQKWNEETEREQEQKMEKIPVTTADLKIDYVTMGPICAEQYGDFGLEGLFNKCVKELKKKAFDMSADAVICMRTEYDGRNGCMLMYGTAVKKRAQKPAK